MIARFFLPLIVSIPIAYGNTPTPPVNGPEYLSALTQPSTLLRLHDDIQGPQYTFIVEPPQPYVEHREALQWAIKQLPETACRKIRTRDDTDLDYARWYQYLYRYRSIDVIVQNPGQSPLDSYKIQALPCTNL